MLNRFWSSLNGTKYNLFSIYMSYFHFILCMYMWNYYLCYNLPLRMSGRPVQSRVAHGKVCRSVPYNAWRLTSVLTKCQLCPKNPPCNSDHPHKFSELPLGDITLPTENHSSNRTQALDGLIKGLLGSIYRYSWLAEGAENEVKLWLQLVLSWTQWRCLFWRLCGL